MKQVSNFFLLFYFTAFAMCCRGDRSKAKHDRTTVLCNKSLFVETYKIFESGAYGGDKVSDYLTDSANFRIYIGTFDNADGGYSFECKEDSVYVYLIDQRPTLNKILNTRVYSITNLKKQRKFE